MDIVCVQQPDGSFRSSPFHVRFGKLKLLKSARKTVTISVNGVESDSVQLVLGREGEAFFLREPEADEIVEQFEVLQCDDPAQQPDSDRGISSSVEEEKVGRRGPKSEQVEC